MLPLSIQRIIEPMDYNNEYPNAIHDLTQYTLQIADKRIDSTQLIPTQNQHHTRQNTHVVRCNCWSQIGTTNPGHCENFISHRYSLSLLLLTSFFIINSTVCKSFLRFFGDSHSFFDTSRSKRNCDGARILVRCHSNMVRVVWFILVILWRSLRAFPLLWHMCVVRFRHRMVRSTLFTKKHMTNWSTHLRRW